MKRQNAYQLTPSIMPVVFAVALLWVIQSAGVLFHLDLSLLGVIPHDVVRLYGIVTSPLVHGSYEHLFNNTLPLIVLGSMVRYGYPSSKGKVLLWAWLTSGVGIWLFGRESVHLGASGVSHGLFFFLFTVSLLRKDKRSVALMMIAFFMYGGMVMSIFPRDPGISYEAHFFGALGGVIAAALYWKRDPKPAIKRYKWESHADEDDPVIGDLWQQSPHPDQPDTHSRHNVAQQHEHGHNAHPHSHRHDRHYH
ncbi:rhomboid family intramembrane serine protease [Alteromonas sp. AMM-1]|uniref:rhomboid family intramembrane serine protease n=1 Tax=Alteromonas sp. AMM-1 TaxID=3394233 RepID=UPI0039A6E026